MMFRVPRGGCRDPAGDRPVHLLLPQAEEDQEAAGGEAARHSQKSLQSLIPRITANVTRY